jgi:hypothetical protein
MGQPIVVRTDFTAVEVRRLARRAKDSDQVRRLLAIAAVLDGASRAEAANHMTAKAAMPLKTSTLSMRLEALVFSIGRLLLSSSTRFPAEFLMQADASYFAWHLSTSPPTVDCVR